MKTSGILNIRKVSVALTVIFVSFVMLSQTGCKAKKIQAEQKKQEALKIEKAKNTLNLILNNTINISLADQEKKIEEIKSQNITDPEVVTLIQQAEDKLKNNKIAEQKRIDEEKKKLEDEKKRQEEELKNKMKPDMQTQFNTLCDEIALAGKNGKTDEANAKIAEALKYFTADDALVLIIISKSGANTDYDKPTNAKTYLNYLKDRKENKNKVDKTILDANGKIKELELIKK